MTKGKQLFIITEVADLIANHTEVTITEKLFQKKPISVTFQQRSQAVLVKMH